MFSARLEGLLLDQKSEQADYAGEVILDLVAEQQRVEPLEGQERAAQQTLGALGQQLDQDFPRLLGIVTAHYRSQ